MDEKYQEAHAADDLHAEFPSLSPRLPEIAENSSEYARAEEEALGAVALSENPAPETEAKPDNKPEIEESYESVLKLLLERKQNGYRRGIDNDGHKIGLAFDAGAYAGVVSLAMARKLQVAGLLDYVDAFYGLSAGGVNAAYAATGQIKEGMDAYVNLMPDNNLVELPSIWQILLRKKKIKMDLNVLRKAIYKDHPLKIDELFESKVPVIVGVTDLTDPYHADRMFRSTDAEKPEEFIEQLIAGCNLPVIAGGPIVGKDGHQYTDGTMAWANSVELAMKDGCTEVLSLANSAVSSDEDKSIRSKVVGTAAGSIAGVIGNQYLVNKRPDEVHDDIRAKETKLLLDKLRHPLEHLVESITDGDITYTPQKYQEVLARKRKSELDYSHGVFVKKNASWRGDVTVERIYPPDIAGLPELLTADKKRLRIGIRAGRLAIRKSMENVKREMAGSEADYSAQAA